MWICVGVITSPDDYTPETVSALKDFLDTTTSVSELRPGKAIYSYQLIITHTLLYLSDELLRENLLSTYLSLIILQHHVQFCMPSQN